MANNEDKKKALDAAIAKLEKDFGKGTVMKLGDPAAQVSVRQFRQDLSVWILHWDSEVFQEDVWLRSTDRSPVVRQQLHCI